MAAKRKKRSGCSYSLDLLPAVCESEEEEKLENDLFPSVRCVGVSSSLAQHAATLADTRPCVSLVTRAVDDEVTTEHTSLIEQKLSPEVYPMSFLAQTKLERIELVLDSGANEFMLSNADLVTSLESRKTKIITAWRKIFWYFRYSPDIFVPGWH